MFLLSNGLPFLGRVVLFLLVMYVAASWSSSSSIFGSPYWSKSCSLATPSIPMMFLFPLLTTTRLGFIGSVMKKHWSTLVASTHGSFFEAMRRAEKLPVWQLPEKRPCF